MERTSVKAEKENAIMRLRRIIEKIELAKFVTVARTLEVFTDSRKSEEHLKIHVEGMDCEITSSVYVHPEVADAQG